MKYTLGNMRKCNPPSLTLIVSGHHEFSYVFGYHCHDIAWYSFKRIQTHDLVSHGVEALPLSYTL